MKFKTLPLEECGLSFLKTLAVHMQANYITPHGGAPHYGDDPESAQEIRDYVRFYWTREQIERASNDVREDLAKKIAAAFGPATWCGPRTEN